LKLYTKKKMKNQEESKERPEKNSSRRKSRL